MNKNSLLFPLKSLSGEAFDPLLTYKGTPILMIFYHTSCLGCTGRALPLAFKLQKDHPSVQLVVIHTEFNSMKCSIDDILSVFTDRHPPFPIYLDENAFNFNYFEAQGTPHWLLFDKRGQLKHSIFGSQANAHNRLLYALEELLHN